MLTYFVYPSLMRPARWAQIAEVVVTARCRRRGIGRALLAETLRHLTALGLRDVSVSTQVENEAASALYRGMGFVRELRTLERPLAEEATE